MLIIDDAVEKDSGSSYSNFAEELVIIPQDSDSLEELALELNQADQGTVVSSSSSSSSSEWTISPQEALYFSIPSNLLFLLGSICYTIVSALDLEWEEADELDPDDDGDNDDDSEIDAAFDYYKFLCLVGASLFVLNAIVDMTQCLFLQRISRSKGYFCHQELIACASSAFLFGCAALLDLMTSVSVNIFSISGSDTGAISIASAHLYLVSACCAMANSRIGYSNNFEMMSFVGDAMFLVGSFIDVVISYISDPDIIASNQHVLLRLGMVSSVLWLIDAMFYLVADIFFYKFETPVGVSDEETVRSPLLLLAEGDQLPVSDGGDDTIQRPCHPSMDIDTSLA